jgi:hypothetical protein
MVLLATAPVFAQLSEIKQIQIPAETSDPLTIYLPAGQGVTLAFDKTEETIETIWLDNKRFVGIDSNGCLNGLNGSCAKNEATALHLNLIETRTLNPISKIDRSVLTVVTVNKQGRRHYFIYNIYPTYSSYSNDNTKLIEYVMASATTKYDVDKLVRNIKKAIDTGLIRDPEFVNRSRKLIALLNENKPVEEAAQKAGLSPRFIQSMLAK